MVYSDYQRKQFIEKIAKVLGPLQFNQCVESVSQTKYLGRLRYWQEKIIDENAFELSEIERHFFNSFSKFDIFIFIFNNENRQNYTISLEEFQSDPFKYIDDDHCRLPISFIRKSMDNVSFRENLFEILIFSYYWHEDFEGDMKIVKYFRDIMTENNWIECIAFLRKEIDEPQEKWEAIFAATFPESSDFLV